MALILALDTFIYSWIKLAWGGNLVSNLFYYFCHWKCKMEIRGNIFIRQDDMKWYKYEEEKPENYWDVKKERLI